MHQKPSTKFPCNQDKLRMCQSDLVHYHSASGDITSRGENKDASLKSACRRKH